MKQIFVLMLLFLFPSFALSQSAAQLLFEKGLKFYTLEDIYDNSINLNMFVANRYFLKSGELGKTEAHLYSGELNKQGYFVTEENFSSELINKAERGEAFSSFALAQCYHFGWGTDKNVIKAKKYYYKFMRDLLDGKQIDEISSEAYDMYMAALLLIYCIDLYEYEYGDIDDDIIDDIKDFGEEQYYSPALLEYAFLLLNEGYDKHDFKKGVKTVEEAGFMGNHAAAGLMAAIYAEGLYGQEKNDVMASMWREKFLTGKFK